MKKTMNKLFHFIMWKFYSFLMEKENGYTKWMKYANKSSYHEFMLNYPNFGK